MLGDSSKKKLSFSRILKEASQVQGIGSYAAILMWTIAIYSSTHDAARSLIASGDLWLNRKWDDILTRSAQPLEQQRAIQRHYLSYGVYIPIDDIVVDAKQPALESVQSLLQNACGKGRAYIWVPLHFQLPVFGEKVVEWCLVKA